MSEEAKLVLDKTYTCPICDNKFKSKAIKTGVARFDNTCFDLRPVYKNINVTKYDVTSCNFCGYTSITKFFTPLTPVEKMNISKNVKENFTPQDPVECEEYTFEMALRRYKLALISATYKGTKPSHIGYVCLKMCWLYQDMAEALPEDDPNTPALREQYMNEALNASSNAYTYLSKARMEESSPICGMDDNTYDYLLAALAFREKEYDNSLRLLSGVITSRSTSSRLKDKALNLKEEVVAAKGGLSDNPEQTEE